MYGNYAPRAHNYGKTTQNGFGGINANKYADNGEVLRVMDMTSDEYPLLATRPPRYRCGSYDGEIIGAAVIDGEPAYVTRTADEYGYSYSFYYKGLYSIGRYGDIERAAIAAVGDYIVLMPFQSYFDKTNTGIDEIFAEDFIDHIYSPGETGTQYILEAIWCLDEYGQNPHLKEFTDGEIFYIKGFRNPERAGSMYRTFPGTYRYTQVPELVDGRSVGTFEKIGARFNSMRCDVDCPIEIKDGTYAGEPAHGNVIEFKPETQLEINMVNSMNFRAGDAVKISGCANEAYNKTVVIREVNGWQLIFYDNTFELPEGSTKVTESGAVVSRDIPEMDVLFHHNNRLWGAKGRSIYCSKAGDPLIWSDYESLADGCWWADTGNTDTFGITGGCSYTYPRFFSEDHIFTVYGDTPADYTIIVTQAQGAARGCRESFAVVNGMLVYLSKSGFLGYTGSLPQKIDYDLGDAKIKKAMAVSDGMKYFAWVTDEAGNERLLVYDSARGLWHEESGEGIEALWYSDHITAAYDGEIWTLGKPWKIPTDRDSGEVIAEEDLTGRVEFADFTLDSVNRKQLREIIIRHDISSELTVKVFLDDALDSTLTRTIKETGKKTTIIPCKATRCDHWRIELEGPAPWVVYSIAYDVQEGSAKR